MAVLDNRMTKITAQVDKIHRYLKENKDVEEEVLMKEYKLTQYSLYTLLSGLTDNPDIYANNEFFIKKNGKRLKFDDITAALKNGSKNSKGPKQAERLLYLFHHLHNAIPDGGLTMKELKNKYTELIENCDAQVKTEGALKRMIERDLQKLEEMAIGLKRPLTGHKKYCLNEIYLPKLRAESAVSVYVSMLLFQNTLLEEATFSARTELEKSFFNKTSNNASMLADRIHIVGDTLNFPENFRNYLGHIIKAVLECHPIRVTYENNLGKISIRTLEPVGIVCKRGVWYFIACVPDINDYRTFRVDQVQDIYVYELEKFEYPEGFSIDEHIGDSWGVFCNDETCQVKLKFSPEVSRRVKNIRYHHSQEIIEEDDNGAITLKFEVCGLIELKPWLLQWGDQVEVLEPESLRKDLLNDAFKIVNMYQRKKRSRKRLNY